MQTYQIDDDRWMPLERAATFVREMEQVRVNSPVVLEALDADDKREPTFGRWEVRYAAFLVKAKQLAEQSALAMLNQPKGAVADRITALEAQVRLDRRRNDAAIEAMQRQLDRLWKQVEGMDTFMNTVTK